MRRREARRRYIAAARARKRSDIIVVWFDECGVRVDLDRWKGGDGIVQVYPYVPRVSSGESVMCTCPGGFVMRCYTMKYSV